MKNVAIKNKVNKIKIMLKDLDLDKKYRLKKY
jgi:hypothetical protein